MRKFLWSLFELLETVTIAVVAVVLIRMFVAQPFLVNGASMEPNFHDGNYLLIDELTYRFREPTRGEVIVFKYPGDRRSYYIKRIIGLPGERITIQQGNVLIYRGGKQIALQETYAVSGHSVRNLELTLGPKDYFVMGDNRSFSFDSRSWGPVDRSLIIGIARLRLWPINQMTAFAAPVY